MNIYVVDHEALDKDFKRPPHWLKYQLSSLEKDSITGGVRGFLKARKRKESPEKYIAEKKIECVPFARIISKYSVVGPEDVDVLAIDVEGFDAKILSEALDVPGLLPGVIVFEQKIVASLFPSELQAILTRLEQNGYSTGDCKRANTGDASGPFKCQEADVIAVRKGASSYEKLHGLSLI